MAINATIPSADHFLDMNSELLLKYIRGSGIGLTTSDRPLKVPKNVDMEYLGADGKMSGHIPDGSKPSGMSVGDFMLAIQALKPGTYDFCILDHVLDHCGDPEKLIGPALQILKSGGVVFLIFSGKDTMVDGCIRDFLKDEASAQLKIVEMSINEVTGEKLAVIEKDNYLPEIIRLLDARSSTKNSATVDVVIPVYNAYDDLVKCLHSALVHQDGYRIVLINDMSSDPRIGDLFSMLKKYEGDDLVVLANPENLGFVKTVNIGMKLSASDVILLNSDTIVTRDWALKLKKCAYSDPSVATATPFTNNGTICSIPEFGRSNKIPAGYTVDAFAAFVEAISLREYPRIPTAVGFCMYIKRGSLDRVGYFNEEKFGKGYSEENDFCMRASKLGLKNVLCDDTFVYHKGSASFLENTTVYLEKNLSVLLEMYPEYMRTVTNFCNSDPLKPLQDNVKFRMKTWDITGKKKKVLYILHHLGGGTEKYAMEMVQSFAQDHISYVLQVCNKKMVLTEYNNGAKLKHTFNLSHAITTEMLHDPEYVAVAKKILSTFKIDLVHVHHLIGHTLDIFSVAKAMGIPTIYTPNDYYCVCPATFLVDKDHKYCSNIQNTDKCSECLYKKSKLKKGFILQWRKHFQSALDDVDMIVASNPAVLDILRKCYRLDESRSLIIEPGHSMELLALSQDRVERDVNKPFVIAYIGGLGKSHKGYDVFYQLARSKNLVDKTKWMIIGISETHDIPGYYKDCNIHIYGRFKDYPEISPVLQGVDLVINPSLCETFSYTLSEAWSAGIPVLVSNFGAMRDRVEKTGGGWCADVSDYRFMEKKILDIINDPDDYRRKKEAARKVMLKSLDKAHEEYKELYVKCIERSSPAYAPEFVLSRGEILETIEADELAKENTTQNVAPNAVNDHLSLPQRLIKCYRENGLIYTVNRFGVFLKSSRDLIKTEVPEE